MAYRIAIQIFFLMLPFLVYGVYRYLLADAKNEGRKVWPINTLFITGAVISAVVWVVSILTEDRRREACRQPARMENGVFISSSTEPCEKDVTQVGIPDSSINPRPAKGISANRPDSSDRIRAIEVEPIADEEISKEEEIDENGGN